MDRSSPGRTAVVANIDASDDSSLLQQIKDSFSAAVDVHATDVGGLLWVESLQTHVAFFVLGDITDPSQKARVQLPAGRCDSIL